MRRKKRIWTELIAFPNLWLASQRAAEHKRYQLNVAAFLYQLESELLHIQQLLLKKAWRPGGFRTFKVYDPKERMISAAPFADRVVHHALYAIIEPVFEPSFIYDSYANRCGKGTHRAIWRYRQFARRYTYVLKCDIRKFFPSIDHQVLKRELRRWIGDPDVLWLADSIIDGSNTQEEVISYFPGDDLFTPIERRHGLPIGNLTSQFWANVYLNRFDHFVKETLGVHGYIRYVDDFVLFADSPAQLHVWQAQLQLFLNDLRLQLHPRKTQIHRTADGVPFLGFRIWPDHHLVLKTKAKRYRRFLKQKLGLYRAGKLTSAQLELALNAWLGHIRFGQCQRLEYEVYWQLRRAGIEVLQHPNGSWRVLEIVKHPQSPYKII